MLGGRQVAPGGWGVLDMHPLEGDTNVNGSTFPRRRRQEDIVRTEKEVKLSESIPRPSSQRDRLLCHVTGRVICIWKSDNSIFGSWTLCGAEFLETLRSYTRNFH